MGKLIAESLTCFIYVLMRLVGTDINKQEVKNRKNNNDNHYKTNIISMPPEPIATTFLKILQDKITGIEKARADLDSKVKLFLTISTIAIPVVLNFVNVYILNVFHILTIIVFVIIIILIIFYFGIDRQQRISIDTDELKMTPGNFSNMLINAHESIFVFNQSCFDFMIDIFRSIRRYFALALFFFLMAFSTGDRKPKENNLLTDMQMVISYIENDTNILTKIKGEVGPSGKDGVCSCKEFHKNQVPSLKINSESQ